jgi:phage-related protein
MERTVAYRGLRYTIAYAVERRGGSPGAVFFDALSLLDKAKLMKLFEMLGEHGKITNPEKFGDLGDGFREFKSHQIRMPCHFAKGGLVLVTHGFIKQRDKAPKEEIARAKRIFQEDCERFREV